MNHMPFLCFLAVSLCHKVNLTVALSEHFVLCLVSIPNFTRYSRLWHADVSLRIKDFKTWDIQ
jgi:hypothetical protein